MGHQRMLAANLACLDTKGCASAVTPVLVMRCIWSSSVPLAALRGHFPDNLQAHQTMQQFLWQADLLQVAGFRHEKLQTVDPDDGPNISLASWNDVMFLSCLVGAPLIWHCEDLQSDGRQPLDNLALIDKPAGR